jgi:hypothetical protein
MKKQAGTFLKKSTQRTFDLGTRDRSTPRKEQKFFASFFQKRSA